MFDAMMSSASLFFQGKLFKDNAKAMQLLALGAIVGAGLTVGVGLVAPNWVAAIAGGAVSGLLQPYLYKNIKYA